MPDRRTIGGMAVAILLIIGGTLATGLLPSSTPYQVLAGGIIVAGFGVAYWTLGALDWE